MKTSQPAPTKLRPRGQLPVIAGVVLGVAFTLTSAAAQLLPGGPRPPVRRPIDDELAAIVQQRRDRIAQLQADAPGERCHPPTARELARLLVMDGQGPLARRFADAYEQRCGDDPVIRTWRDAPLPTPRRRP